MKIISLDPGRTTGYTVGRLGEQSPLKFESRQEKFDHMQLYTFLKMENPDWVVCEAFDFRNKVRTGTDLFPAELIGALHIYHGFYKCGLTFQNASTHGAGGKSGYFNNAKLQQLGFYLKGKDHAMDSLRILLYWYEFGVGYQFNNKRGFEEMMVHHL